MSHRVQILVACMSLACGGDDRGGADAGVSGITFASQTGAASGQSTDGDTEDPSDSATSAVTDSEGDDVSFDLGVSPDGGPLGCKDGVGEECPGCTAVDILFVIDNSLSMEPHQIALTQAFPSFAATILEALPEGVNIHIGITSTEMGYSPEGGYDENNFCIGTGEGGAPASNYYETPDVAPSTTNGAQGRLYEAGGIRYFDIDQGAPANEVQALEEWFADAAHIGEGGSNVEMTTAAAAWACDPANAGTNAGFLRDEGAVLAFFVVQDEPDQTPIAETDALLAKIETAKTLCGGWDCVIGGGFVNQFCMPQVSLGEMFAALSEPAVTAMLPMEGTQAEDFNPVLRDTLAQAIVEKCGEIVPPG
jgi:hypothetical protein